MYDVFSMGNRMNEVQNKSDQSLPGQLFRRSVLMAAVFGPVLISCQKTDTQPALFINLPPDETGIHFINTLEEKPGNNILESDFFYNGGGIAVGDINQDSLPDIYFTANQGENALYLNRGNYRFENITSKAGLSDSDGWTAGTAMVDINGNGLLDIYVCKAGKEDEADRRNKLFINNGLSGDNGLPAFTEMAAGFGLDDPGYCTQPVFFDYNGNGLLDLFIVNYNTRNFSGFDITTIRNEVDPFAGDKLYRNNGDGSFTDVSTEAGIMQNPIGFGLSAAVSDLNEDGLPDIYVTNDFMERDYMYINNGDGTFSDEIVSRTNVTSYFSMGSDIADINNDGLPDIMVVDMLPPGYQRQQVFKTPDYGIYNKLADNGYHRKNMRNVLQVNNGNGIFTEAGQMAGIYKTDWSWSVLLADFDNDGNKDVHVTNGFPRFYTNLDYLNNILWKQFPDEELPDDPELKYDLVQQMDQVEMQNFAFRNEGNLSFSESTTEWGLNRNSVSGSAAYVDLNNNGALDLVVSNINEPPFIFKNNARLLTENNYLKIRLKGTGGNTYGTGAKVKVTTDGGKIIFQEAFSTRGFQASVDPVLHFGLGAAERVDVEIIWPDQSSQVLYNSDVNRLLIVNQKDAEQSDETTSEDKSKMFTLLDNKALGIDFNHQSSLASDLLFNPMMPHTLSNSGPVLTTADVNGDGLPDVFIGGGQDQPSALYLQQNNGTFLKANIPVFEEHSGYQDTDAVFFDANGNGLPDLYVVSGGNFDRLNGEAYQDRLYINEGFGNFSYSVHSLPRMHSSGGSVTIVDYDENGTPDLFVGGRVLTGRYPMAPRSYLLKNNDGIFEDVTAVVAPGLMEPGLVTDAIWVDTDGSGQNELILAGEWMPIRVFKMRNGIYEEITEEAGFEKTSGWWNVLKVTDLNGDGAPDIIAGNRGLNSTLRASPEEPVMLYLGDFNDNGMDDPFLTQVTDGRMYPVFGRDRFLRQLPDFREKFPDYKSWSEASAEDILSARQIRKSEKFTVDTFASAIFINNGNGKFQGKAMPVQAQTAPVYDMIIADFYGNGLPDILVAGNNFGTQSEFGPMAGQGVILKAEGDFNFSAESAKTTGFYGAGDIRSLEIINTPGGSLFLLGANGKPVVSYIFTHPEEIKSNWNKK